MNPDPYHDCGHKLRIHDKRKRTAIRIHLTELPPAGTRDENIYLNLHDHYIQTGKLRARIKELEMQLAETAKSPID